MIQINPNLSEKRKIKLLEAECANFENDVKNGVAGKDDIKFMDFALNEWKPNYADKNLEITTLTRYMEFLNTRIFPAIRTSKIERYYTTGIKQILQLFSNTRSK